jgi:ribonuclease PH
VGVYRGTPVLDLDYAEDSDCDTDMNVVMNDGGGFIELQGTAEGHAFRRDELDALLGLAERAWASCWPRSRRRCRHEPPHRPDHPGGGRL